MLDYQAVALPTTEQTVNQLSVQAVGAVDSKAKYVHLNVCPVTSMNKRKWNSALGHLMMKEFDIMWQHLIFISFIYIVQLCKDLKCSKYPGLLTLALHDRYFQLPNANNAQTIWELGSNFQG